MPQMMPMNWVLLLLYFIMIFLLINLSIMFFVKFFMMSKFNKIIMKKLYLIKWL